MEATAAAQDGSEAADGDTEAAERPQKRARLKGGRAGDGAGSGGAAPGSTAGKATKAAKAADVMSPAIRREWQRFAEALAGAERAAQAAEVIL